MVKYISEKRKTKQGKQDINIKTTKEMRCSTYTYHNIPISTLFALLEHYTGGSSPRTQVKIKQVTLRFEKSDKSLPQMSSSPASQRKLLRLKDSSNKRHGMEQLHLKGKTGKHKSRRTVLRKRVSKAEFPSRLKVGGKWVTRETLGSY